MSNVLNLSNADTRGFDAIPSGRYDALVWQVTPVETTNPDGNLPVGTPGINIQFKIDGGDYDNRKVFTRFYFAPDGYKNKEAMDNMLGSFFSAIGYSDEEIKSGSFELNHEDMEGRPCAVVVRKRQYGGGDVNDVTSVRPRGQATETEGAGLL